MLLYTLYTHTLLVDPEDLKEILSNYPAPWETLMKSV